MSGAPGPGSHAERAADLAGIRELATLEELKACVELQEAVWGEGFSERAPVSLLRVARRLGGVVAGAFDRDGVLVGFVFGLTGLEEGRAVHWSDMLAVRPGLRDRGLGTALKRFQRARCLERGVTRMYWTFDPLEARNARMNLGKLGAVGREYVRDMYGSTDSPLHRGMGTDRLVALWLLDSERVAQRLAGEGRLPRPDEMVEVPGAFSVSEDGRFPKPGTLERHLPRGAARRVPVPARIQQVKAVDHGLAVAWREAVRVSLEAGLAEGLEVTELLRGAGELSHLLLEPRREWRAAGRGSEAPRAGSPDDPADPAPSIPGGTPS